MKRSFGIYKKFRILWAKILEHTALLNSEEIDYSIYLRNFKDRRLNPLIEET
jgi:hypothetical protein